MTDHPPKLTARNLEILDTIEELTRRERLPPTLREIAAALDLASPNGVYEHIERLRAHGLIASRPGQSRTIRSTREDRRHE